MEHLDVVPALIPLPTTPSRGAGAAGGGQLPGSSHSRRRSLSTGAESLGSPGLGAGTSRMNWGHGPSAGATASSPGDIEEEERQQQQSAGMIESAAAYIHRLKELSSGKRRTKKGKEVDRGDEACGCMVKLAALLKKTPSLRYLLSTDDIIEGCVLILYIPMHQLSWSLDISSRTLIGS